MTNKERQANKKSLWNDIVSIDEQIAALEKKRNEISNEIAWLCVHPLKPGNIIVIVDDRDCPVKKAKIIQPRILKTAPIVQAIKVVRIDGNVEAGRPHECFRFSFDSYRLQGTETDLETLIAENYNG